MTWGEQLIDILAVTWTETAEWLADDLLPTPPQIRMLVDFLETEPGCPHRGLLDLLDCQLVEVAGAFIYKEPGTQKPINVLFLNPRQRMTLGSYMLGEQRDTAFRRISAMPSWREQEKLLVKLSNSVREIC
jgi:hypothetical protein